MDQTFSSVCYADLSCAVQTEPEVVALSELEQPVLESEEECNNEASAESSNVNENIDQDQNGPAKRRKK